MAKLTVHIPWPPRRNHALPTLLEVRRAYDLDAHDVDVRFGVGAANGEAGRVAIRVEAARIPALGARPGVD